MDKGRRKALNRALTTIVCCLAALPACAQPHCYALLIASGRCDPSSEFVSEIRQMNRTRSRSEQIPLELKAPPNDTRVMAALLTERFGWREAKSIQILGLTGDEYKMLHLGPNCDLIGEQATRENIREALEGLRKRATSDDYVVIYYTGHGTTYLEQFRDRGALVTYEGSPALHITQSDFSARVNKIASKHITVVLDACFSGQFTHAKTFVRSDSVEELSGLPQLDLTTISKSAPALPLRSRPAPPEDMKLLQEQTEPKFRQKNSRPLGSSPYRFTLLTACDTQEETQEFAIRYVGGEMHISGFTWALSRALWQEKSSISLDSIYPPIRAWLDQKGLAGQHPLFLHGMQGQELIAPGAAHTAHPRLPYAASARRLQIGRFAGIAPYMRFREEATDANARLVSAARLKVKDLDWFVATLEPIDRAPDDSCRFVLRLFQ